MKILVAEKISEKGIDKLVELGGTVDVQFNLDREKLLEIISDYDAIVVRSVTKINEDFYERAKNLKVVGRAGNGIDNIDLPGATKRGIIVVNTPDANSVSAAELTIGLMLAAARKIPAADRLLKQKKWDRSGFKGVELNGKTVGIVGLGRIGSLVAQRLRGFDMRLIAYDPYITDERFERLGVEKKETLKELVMESDFITVHTPKTEETNGMIGEEQFKIAKPGLRVVNCARGGIIEEAALAKALKEGTVAAAGIDVLVGEPNTTSPLLDLENTVMTPHIGADTLEAQNNVGITIAQEVIHALKGEMVPNAVNLPTLQHHQLNQLKPYMGLGEILGKLYHQIEREAVEGIEIIYQGEVARLETEMITLAVLKGLMEPILKERINYVNASQMAVMRGIQVISSKTNEAEHLLNLIQLKISTKNNLYTYSGTIFGKGEARIVEVNGFSFDVTPSPFMLVAENLDQPGMIGKIGTMLGKNQINIATMQVSRNLKGKKAMMVLTIDSEASREDLRLIEQVEGITRVSFVKL